MTKRFNYTGTCIPGKHYMVDTSRQIVEIITLIEEEVYFTINRPRQYGKTTTLLLLERELTQRGYLAISISFEGIGDTPFENESNFCKEFCEIIAEAMEMSGLEQADFFLKEIPETLKGLSRQIRAFVKELKKEVVLFIDEVDKSSNNQLFLHFLGMLREKYLLRNSGKDSTFHSVILAGVHDIKSIKLKLRPGDKAKYNSPWNIAVDFKVDMSFSAEQIATMLTDYAEEKKAAMDIPLISEKLRYYTSGYPFLVSKLCYIIDSEVMKENRWLPEDVEKSVRLILEEDNTNFGSLIKNLENNSELLNLVYAVIMDGERKRFNIHNPVISLGHMHGIFCNNGGFLGIHNRVYQELIYDYLSSKLETSMAMEGYNIESHFITKDVGLDFNKVLLKFQAFMKEQYSRRDKQFLEKNGRLIFLAFVKPIINGKGYDFKEVQISEEKQIDIIITYGTFRYIIELKVWRGEKAHARGLGQLAGYLERQHCERGYLIIFDFRDKKEWKQEQIQQDGKEIFAVWV